MSSSIQQRPWLRPLTLLLVLAWAAPAPAADPLPWAVQQRVNQAIDRGVRFLNATQGQLGSWSANGKHLFGYAALPGLTLLECGESKESPAVLRAARLVRRAAPNLDKTYEIALSILFLDRLGDPRDEKIIEMLAARLIVGQTATGGWSYRCPALSDQGRREVLTALRRLEDKPHFDPDLLVGGGLDPLAATDPPGRPDLQVTGKDKPDLQVTGKDKPGLTGSVTSPSSPLSSAVDNSPGASASQRSPGETVAVGPESKSISAGKPPAVGPELKFRPGRLPRGGWCIKMGEDIPGGGGKGDGSGKDRASGKMFIRKWVWRLPVMMDPDRLVRVVGDPPGMDKVPRGTTDNSNTQFAMLGLWAARRHGVPMKRSLNLLVYRFRTSQNLNGTWFYRYIKGGGLQERDTMTCVGLLGLAIGHGVTSDRDRLDPKAAARRARDPQLIRGLAALSRFVGQPSGRLFNLPQPNLYFLWSLERVGVLYNLPTIGGKHWYPWAAECLVANQQPLGNWTGGGYHGASPVLDTCMALLVLKRANLAEDLTAQMKISPGELARSVEQHLTSSTPAPQTPGPDPAEDRKPRSPRDRKDTASKPPAPSSLSGLTATPSPAQQPSAAPSTTSAPSSGTQNPGEGEKGGGKKLWVVLMCLAGILLLGLSLFLLLMGRKREEAPTEATAANKKTPVKRSAGTGGSKKAKK